jgi:uncharacterized protein (DUF1501 family)
MPQLYDRDDFLLAEPAMQARATATGTDRKALLVIHLGGAPDTHATFIPRAANPNRAYYDAARPALALPENALTLDADWCLHPELAPLHTIWGAGRLAVVRNAGPLVVPVTRAQYLANSVQLPPQLYSHSDQADQWETGIGDAPIADTGWMGRMAELLKPFNAGSVPPLLSFNGATDMARAFDLRLLSLNSSGLPTRNGESRLAGGVTPIIDAMLAGFSGGHPLIQEYVDSHARSVAATATITAARDAATDPTNIPVDIPLGRSMRMAVRLARQQVTLGHRRTMIFASDGGYDHHANLVGDLAGKYATLAPVLAETYNALVAAGIASQVTVVVYGEFGRSLTQNGSGTDHAWGGNVFVLGGAVAGGWKGNAYSLNPAGPDMVDTRGYLIPTTSVDTLVASLGRWMGIPDALANGVNPLNLLSPNLPNFAARDLPLFV